MGIKLLPIAVLCVALVAPASAFGQSSDPSPGSPSGTIYEIPLEDGRDDAAPGRGRGVGGGTATGEPSSPIRSDNGFGSSSTVPGTSQAQSGPEGEVGQGGGAAAGEDARELKGSSAQRRERSGSGTGKRPGESAIPEGSQSGASSAVVRPAAGTSPSVPRAALLLGLGLLVAVGLAVAARLATRRR